MSDMFDDWMNAAPTVDNDKCPTCGSARMLEGPGYAPEETTCLDCGSQYNRKVRKAPEDKDVRSQLAQEVPFPEGGFDTPEAAMEHLARLKAAAKQLGKTVETSEDRVNTTRRKSHPTSDIDPKMVMAEYNFYQREGETFSQVLATGKGERGVRNYNVLIFVHNHQVGHQCTSTCRELIENG